MAFEALSERLQNSISQVGKGGKISEADLKQMMREIRLALLEADVNFKVVKTFVRKVNERALGSEVLQSLSPAQQVVKIVNEELTELMGGEQTELVISKQPPTIIMMAGLQGAGKTTTVGKLANYMKEQGVKKPLLVAGDVYRPAAIDQLQTIGKQLGFEVYSQGTQVSPVEIARQAVAQARMNGNEAVLIDTAGRLHVNEELMNELRNIKAAVDPDEILLTVDAMTGQDAVNVADAFNQALDITGVVITKLDGDTRGGAALSIRSIINKPIKFTGQGEQLNALEAFHPDRMAGRILGMGDMMTLIEKAQQDFDADQAAKMADKLKDASFDFNDFIDQMNQVRKMGPLKDLIKMIPGMNKIPGLSDFNMDDKDMNRVRAVVQSMTPYERTHPDVISQSRRKRIASGCGQSLQQVNQLIKQFNQARQMMSQMSQGKMGGMNKMMNQMQQQGGGMAGMKGMPAMPPMGKIQSPEQLKKEKEQKLISRMLKKKKRRR